MRQQVKNFYALWDTLDIGIPKPVVGQIEIANLRPALVWEKPYSVAVHFTPPTTEQFMTFAQAGYALFYFPADTAPNKTLLQELVKVLYRQNVSHVGLKMFTELTEQLDDLITMNLKTQVSDDFSFYLAKIVRPYVSLIHNDMAELFFPQCTLGRRSVLC